LPPLAWVGIGCGTLLVIAVILVSMLVGTCTRKVGQWSKEMQKNPEKVAAEMMVRMNPGLEMVAQDEAAGTMTLRVKSTGDEVTLSYRDIADGKLTVKDAEGKVTRLGKADWESLPAWVPRYPNVASTGGGGQSTSGDGAEGVLVFTTTDTPEAVVEWLQQAAGDAGLRSHRRSNLTFGGQDAHNLECSGGGRTLDVHAARAGGAAVTSVTMSFREGARE
jgi:archaellum component FlaG (FlaF/FlaG flagellin family)